MPLTVKSFFEASPFADSLIIFIEIFESFAIFVDNIGVPGKSGRHLGRLLFVISIIPFRFTLLFLDGILHCGRYLLHKEKVKR